MVAGGECKKEVKVGYCFIILYRFGSINKCKQQIKRSIEGVEEGEREGNRGCQECVPITLQASVLSPRLWAEHLCQHLQQLLGGTSKGCQKETKMNACFCMLYSPGDVGGGNSILF